jgi:hypothetical protein
MPLTRLRPAAIAPSRARRSPSPNRPVAPGRGPLPGRPRSGCRWPHHRAPCRHRGRHSGAPVRGLSCHQVLRNGLRSGRSLPDVGLY